MLISSINLQFGRTFLGSEVKRCVIPGRKMRSILFCQTSAALNSRQDAQLISSVVFAIELCHAASVLTDDVIDGDCYRHGKIAIQRQWGDSKSVLITHLMIANAMKIVASYERIHAELLDCYSKMILGEIYDVMIPPGKWIFKGYNLQTYQKTAALFESALWCAVDPTDRGELQSGCRLLGRDFGRLYQLSNDYFDWQLDGVRNRHREDQTWPITFSFPLAQYLKIYGQVGISSALSKKYLTYSEWIDFLTTIWSSGIEEHCLKQIEQTQRTILRRARQLELPLSLIEFYAGITEMVHTREFWYGDY